jgi:hypothetical protein
VKNTKKSNVSGYLLEVTNVGDFEVTLFDESHEKMGSYSLKHTIHSKVRSNQRGIDNMVITLTIEYGRLYRRQGLEFYAVGDRSLPTGLDPDIQKRLRNTVVVLTPQAEIITCYRGNNVIRHVNRKSKYLAVA